MAGLLLISAIGFVVSLVFLVSAKTRQRAKWALLLFAAGVVVFGVAVGSEAEKEAIALGFQNSADQRSAKEAGVSDSKIWTQLRWKIDTEKVQRAAAAEAQKAETQAERTRLLRPASSQLAFTTIIENSRVQYLGGKTDIQKGSARPARAKSLCQEVRGLRFVDWIGQVQTLSTNGDGLGVFSIEIAPQAYLKTWNNALSDISNKTLIAPDSQLYQGLMQMKKGDFVRASGQLFRSEADCFREASLSMDGSMREPEFIARFSSVKAVILP